MLGGTAPVQVCLYLLVYKIRKADVITAQTTEMVYLYE